jgi:hypothetical protein
MTQRQEVQRRRRERQCEKVQSESETGKGAMQGSSSDFIEWRGRRSDGRRGKAINDHCGQWLDCNNQGEGLD